MTMPLVSVSISYGSRILRPFAIVQTEDNVTLRELYTAVCSGKLGDDAPVVEIPGGSASPVKAMVGKDSTGFFQDVPLNVKVSDCCIFGIFFKFCVQPPDSETDKLMQANRVNASNAFDVLMQAAKDKRVPEKRDTSRLKNAKFDLYNVIIQHIHYSGMGWRSESLDVGEHFVQILCDSLWYLDPHIPKLHQQQCTLPTRFDIFIGFNNPAKHKHVPIHLKSDELLTLSQQVYGILEQPWLHSGAWNEMYEAVKSLGSAMERYAAYLKGKLTEVKKNQGLENFVRSAEDSTTMLFLPHKEAQSPKVLETYRTMIAGLEVCSDYDPVFVNDFLPVDKVRRFRNVNLLKEYGLAFPTVMYSHTPGGNLGNYHFIWKIPCDSLGLHDEIMSKSAALFESVKNKLPQFHTRQMRREFMSLFGTVANVKPCFLREMYKRLTGDSSAPNDATTAGVDLRVKQLLELSHPDIMVDLREHNPGRPSKYEPFWVEVSKYVENVIQTAVHERRHGTVTYLAAAMSVPNLLESVSKKCAPGIPVPSAQWLRLQFWPKNPTTKASLQYTGRLQVKYMIQQRQLRKEHIDTHFASAYFRYLKEMAIKFRDNCTLFSVDDKHKIKVGEPGHPVAAVERGKKVVVGLNQTFIVADHDFTKQTLTPSVIMKIEVHDSIEGSFYRGQVFTCLKDSVFQASSPLRHATEMLKALDMLEEPTKEILMLYSDGGPDHRVNYLSVQLSLIAMFLKHDFDAVIAVRTPPGHSWKNPCERIMSILNLALQSVGVMRHEMSPEADVALAKCSNIPEIRAAADKEPQLKESVPDSLQDAITLITGLFQQLKLKEVPFLSFLPATQEQMDVLHDSVHNIDATLPKNATMKTFKESDDLKKFYEKHCQVRHYSFSIVKCTDASCPHHKVPRLSEELFKEVHHIPDPMLAHDGIHFKHFEDVYGKTTSEKDRPSLKTGKKNDHELPFNPSAQTAVRVKRTVTCHECDKPHVIHAAKKLKPKELEALDSHLSDIDYSCGAVLEDFIPEGMATEDHILKKVFVRKDLECMQPVEITYYSSGVFASVCCHCATGDELATGALAQDNYPICVTCKAIPNKAQILKRKRKLTN